MDRLADDYPSYVKTSEIDALRPQMFMEMKKIEDKTINLITLGKRV